LARGLPIGNLTSQLFANIYLNELDHFVKHWMKINHPQPLLEKEGGYYARYTDDFVIVSPDENYLKAVLEEVRIFLRENLKLELHPDKIFIRKYRQGADFLGYVVRPRHILLRTKTKKRIFKKMRRKAEKLRQGIINEEKFWQSLNSYLAVLSHADAYELSEELKNIACFE
jgi:RNA-directed DNA polymerase